MFEKVIGSVRRSRGSSEFDSYYGDLAVSKLSGGPTADEAKRDYRQYLRDRVKSQSAWF